MERAKGVEPSTFSLATRRSTTELCPPNNFLLSKALCLTTNFTLSLRFDLIMEQGTNQDSSVTTVTRMSQEIWVRLTRVVAAKIAHDPFKNLIWYCLKISIEWMYTCSEYLLQLFQFWNFFPFLILWWPNQTILYFQYRRLIIIILLFFQKNTQKKSPQKRGLF